MLQIANISKNYGSKVLFKNASFQVNSGEKIGLVGPNGAGKTTIFRMISGEEYPDEGSVVKTGRPVIGYFSQSTGEMAGRSALEEAMSAVGDMEKIKHRLVVLETQLSEPLADDVMEK
ncbi:MAG: ATP-binding cassette domain-containing protein, partial [Bdellovibrionota bacterium]